MRRVIWLLYTQIRDRAMSSKKKRKQKASQAAGGKTDLKGFFPKTVSKETVTAQPKCRTWVSLTEPTGITQVKHVSLSTLDKETAQQPTSQSGVCLRWGAGGCGCRVTLAPHERGHLRYAIENRGDAQAGNAGDMGGCATTLCQSIQLRAIPGRATDQIEQS